MINRIVVAVVTFLMLVGVTTGLYNLSNPLDVEALTELTSKPIETVETITEIEDPEEVQEILITSAEPILTDEELIAMVIHAEAGAEEMVGKVAVAAVVLNRCDEWGLTVETVIYQPNQFAIANTYTPEDMRAVEIAMQCKDLYPANMLYFRNQHYHNFGVPYMQIGGHYFSLESED